MPVLTGMRADLRSSVKYKIIRDIATKGALMESMYKKFSGRKSYYVERPKNLTAPYPTDCLGAVPPNVGPPLAIALITAVSP